MVKAQLRHGGRISSCMRAKGYRVFSIAGQPVFATPDVGRRLRLAAIARYHAFSFGRGVFRRAIQSATALGVDTLFCQHSSDPVASVTGFCFNEWLAEALAVLGKGSGTVAALVWPSPMRRRRVYAHLIDPDGMPSGFAKVVLDPDDKRQLRAEISALTWVSRHLPPPARTPGLLAAGSFHSSNYAVFEPLPVQTHFGRVCYDELRACLSILTSNASSWTVARLAEVPWWQRFRNSLGSLPPHFVRELDSLLDDGVRLCRVHGDLSRGNVCWSNGSVWIFDWESSCEHGPVLTDEVSYYLSVDRRRFLSNPMAATARLIDRTVGSSPSRRLDVMLALVFLHVSGRRPASLAIMCWPFTGGRE